MKTAKMSGQSKHLAPDSQKRLAAYTTAASLGALFVGPSARAQVIESGAFAPYPATLLADTGTNTLDFPCDIDGDGTNDFQLVLFGEGDVPDHSQVADVHGLINSLSTTNTILNDAAVSYTQAWLGGKTINATTGFPPTYRPLQAFGRLAVAYGNGTLLNNKFPESAALGFSFVGGDSQTHFGYMDVRVNGVTNNPYSMITSVTVEDVYYNATPNAGITIPAKFRISNIAIGAGNEITINFTSNTNTPAAELTLLTSPTLGPSASWTPDAGAVITQTLVANPNGAKPLAHYQAVTTGSNTPSQFFLISH